MANAEIRMVSVVTASTGRNVSTGDAARTATAIAVTAAAVGETMVSGKLVLIESA